MVVEQDDEQGGEDGVVEDGRRVVVTTEGHIYEGNIADDQVGGSWHKHQAI